MAHKFTADFKAFRGDEEFHAKTGDVVEGHNEEWMLELLPNVPMVPVKGTGDVRPKRGRTSKAKAADPVPAQD